MAAQGNRSQSSLFKGIYEFEDPSGTIISAKVPYEGSVDLYNGTIVNVRPNQVAIFVYKGQVADVFAAGSHKVFTDNVPILSRIANWSFGFESPLRAEIHFINGSLFTGRRWGTPQPLLHQVKALGTIPLRCFGNYNFAVKDPRKLFHFLVGTKALYTVSDIEEFIQGQIIEFLPAAIGEVNQISDLSTKHNEISENLCELLNGVLSPMGVLANNLQILSLLPSKEVIDAIDAKTAISMFGSPKDYLIYKAANSLGMSNGDDKPADPMQMLMGLVMSKGLLGMDYHEKEKQKAESTAAGISQAKMICDQCKNTNLASAKFCSNCGRKF
jgi:membrane protease subunit (stomatin/prohibitin family)